MALFSIAEITNLVTDGKHGDCRDEDGSGYYFLSSKELRDGRLIYDNPRQIRKDDFLETHRRTNLMPGDVLLANTGASIGRVGIAQQDSRIKFTTFQKSISVIKSKPELVNNKYLYYFFLANSKYLEELGNGTAQPNLLIGDIKKIRLALPDMKTQEKIAAILSAYDDLIENNKRRIALLENMAEEIYREWFVRFRFPGYQTAEFEKGIPKGWPVVELKEIAVESSKNTKPGNHLKHRKYLPLDALGSNQFLPLDHYEYTEAQSSLVTFEKGDFIFGAMRPYQHKIVVAPFDGITRTTCFVIKPFEQHFYSYLYLTLFKKTTIDYAMLISNGSDRPYTVWNKGMERMEVLKPDNKTLIAFGEKVRPIIDSVLSYYFIQKNLSDTRDILLPRLISGKLSVDNLDIQFPPSMQESSAA